MHTVTDYFDLGWNSGAAAAADMRRGVALDPASLYAFAARIRARGLPSEMGHGFDLPEDPAAAEEALAAILEGERAALDAAAEEAEALARGED